MDTVEKEGKHIKKSKKKSKINKSKQPKIDIFLRSKVKSKDKK